MNEQPKKYLNEQKEHLQKVMSDISLDFCNDHKASDSDYLCDAISECADNYVDIYNADDLLEWCKDNYEYVEQAIDEFGVAKDRNGRVDFLRTIAQGQFLKNEEELHQDIEEIIQLLTINYLLKNEIELDNEKIDEMLDDLTSYVDQNDRIDTIVDKINEYIKKEV